MDSTPQAAPSGGVGLVEGIKRRLSSQAIDESSHSHSDGGSALGSARDDWVNIMSPLKTAAEGMKAAAAAAVTAASERVRGGGGSGGSGGGDSRGGAQVVVEEAAVDALTQQ